MTLFFARVGGIWQEWQKILGPNGQQNDFFGYSVSLDGDTAVVGAMGEYSKTGAAYLFSHSSGTWVQGARLVGIQDQEEFARSVSVNGDRLVAGAPVHDVESVLGAGAAYVYSRQASAWNLDALILNDSPAFGDNFGRCVVTDGLRVAAGAPRDDAPLIDSRSLYLLETTSPPQPYCTAKVNSCGGIPSIESTGLPSSSAMSGFTVFANWTRATKAGLLIYTDAGRGNSPFQGGLLCIEPGAVKRSVAVLDKVGTAGCDGVLSIDMNAFAHGLLGGNPLPSLMVPGTFVNCQFWGRDTPGNSLLSDALEYRVCD
jgi:hypothetical protein